jgi:formylglycine-generating enzyme required for sulfatase activity
MLVRGGLVLGVLAAAWSAWNAYDLSVRYGTSNPCDMVHQRLADTYDLGSDRSRNLATWLAPAGGIRRDGAMACWGSMFFGIKTRTEVAYAAILGADEIANRWEAGGSGRDLAVWETIDATSEVLKFLLIRGQHSLMKAALAKSLRPDELREKIKVAAREKCSLIKFTSEERDACATEDFRLLSPKTAPSFVEPKMVELKRGLFSMGSTKYEVERPPHSVVVPAFAISKYEVTFDEYDAFVLATGARRPDDLRQGRGQRPVVDVSWDDAKAYVEWLSKVTGAPYRLPSEAEWEFAARAGTTTSYWWGDEVRHTPPRPANFGGERVGGTRVGSYPANPWGLHDLNGNVWEWVEDCWHNSYEAPDRPDDGGAWTSGDCSRRVLRGGSWSSGPEKLRSASRNSGSTSYRDYLIGFRVARTLSRSESVTP